METKKKILLILVLAFGLIVCLPKVGQAALMGTAWTYQGRLMDANKPADGLYDLQFKVYDANVLGTQKGSTIDVNEVDVNDGYFTVLLDFDSVFDGDARWLEIAVRPGELKDPNTYKALSPRQKVTPTPYAIYAKTADSISVGIDWIEIFNRPAGLDDGDQVGITIETDPTVLASVKDGITWTEVSNRPAGLDDGDQVGITSETDPTVLASVKDGVAWSEVSNIPAGFADGVDNTGITSETDPVYSGAPASGITAGNITNWNTAYGWGNHALAGYLKTETDPQVGSNTTNYIPKWNGSALVSGTIYDSGNVGIGTSNPAAKLDVSGDISAASVYKIGGSTVLSAPGTQNTLVGLAAGAVNTGSGNTFTGYQAGIVNTSGASNVFSGCQAGYKNTTGNDNTFSGFHAGYWNNGDRNTFLGREAGATSGTTNDNTFSGYYAGYSNSANFNSFFGSGAGQDNTTGNYNTFSGYGAGNSNTTGYDNTFSGSLAGYSNTTGNDNTFSGYGAGNLNTTGGNNTFSGYRAGANNTTGNGNVFVGSLAGYYETGSNKLYIANSSGTPLIYGDFSVNTLGFGTTSIPAGRAINTATGAYLTTGGAWTNFSSRDAKENITPVDARNVLEKLVKVPVSIWNYKVEDISTRHIGPMAQDLYEAFELNNNNESIATIDGDGISFAAIQGLYQIVKEKDAVIESLQKENNEIKNRLSAIESLLAKLSLTQEGGIK
jgi:hypothetical protein